MRITVTRNKTRQQVMDAVNKGADDLFRGLPLSGLQITDQTRSWNGSTMKFRFSARLGPVFAPVSGRIEVTDRDVSVDLDLPAWMQNFIPEDRIRTGVEGRVRGLLNA